MNEKSKSETSKFYYKVILLVSNLLLQITFELINTSAEWKN